MIHISTRKDGIETKKKILTVCVQLFLEQGYKQTTISQIVKKAGVARGSFQNLFSTKDAILMELVGTMFSGQFGVAKNIVGDNTCLSPAPQKIVFHCPLLPDLMYMRHTPQEAPCLLL